MDATPYRCKCDIGCVDNVLKKGKTNEKARKTSDDDE